MSDNPVMVSIICLAYNHEKYIRNTLESFVSQKTNFPFEVVIHDDCSTDATAAIIREYEQKYPQIIRPIYQTENQYSKGVWITRDVVAPQTRGKYVAVCEGDDYWCDENKLQLQYDFLSSHPKYSACVHRTVFHNVSTGEETYVPDISESRDFSLEEIVWVGGGIFGTNSLMARREVYCDLPECFRIRGFGDYQLFIYAAMEGKVHCMDRAMSVYNVGISGSWTERVWEDKERRIRHYNTCIALLEQIDAYYEGKYHRVLSEKILETQYQILKLNNDRKRMREPQYRTVYRQDRTAELKRKLVAVCPFLLKINRLIKGNKK